jgi:hypothetical protein
VFTDAGAGDGDAPVDEGDDEVTVDPVAVNDAALADIAKQQRMNTEARR